MWAFFIRKNSSIKFSPLKSKCKNKGMLHFRMDIFIEMIAFSPVYKNRLLIKLNPDQHISWLRKPINKGINQSYRFF